MMCATGSMAPVDDSPFELRSVQLGALPIVNHFCDRIGVDRLLARHLPGDDRRLRLASATVIGMVVRNLVLGREPVYALSEWALPYDPALLGLGAGDIDALNDDRVGRALATLFDADRATLATELVLSAIERFGLDLSQLHNDSTTVTFSGAYTAATGRARAGKRTARITHGHNKDHRPDLKQLLWILTVTSDGAVPVCYRVADGNTTDDKTHIETWNTLRELAGTPDFLYVADCKLCTREQMGHIQRRGGRFLTVLPRSRKEDRVLRERMYTSPLEMVEVMRRPARRHGDPDDIWHAVESPIGSAEGHRIVLVRSSAKAERDANARLDRINAAYIALDQLNARLAGPKCRIRKRIAAEAAALETVATATRWIDVTVNETSDDTYRQERPGRPGPNTRYKRTGRARFAVTWHTREDTIEHDAASDGCFPLITNDTDLTTSELLAAYKYQPNLERRHAQLKGPQLVAPVFLKTPARIEGLLCCHFIALLIQALIEREIRNAMHTTSTPTLPLYPEDRPCTAPSAPRTLEIFNPITRHHLHHQGHAIQTFQPTLTPLQQQILDLLHIPHTTYTPVT